MPRTAAWLVAVLVPAVLLPAAAHAQEVTVDDTVGDAKALNFESGILFADETDGPLFLDAPAETSTDVVATTIDHARKRVTLTVRVRDLAESTEHSLEARVFTPGARYSLLASRSADGTTDAQLWPEVMVATESDEPRPYRGCRSVRARYDLDADVITASFPTACIDRAPWVQLAVGVSRFLVTPVGDGSVNVAGFADDAFRSSLSERSRARSPKVRRG